MFRLKGGRAAVGAINALAAAALLLFLLWGPLGLFIFLGTWPLIALAGLGGTLALLGAER